MSFKSLFFSIILFLLTTKALYCTSSDIFLFIPEPVQTESRQGLNLDTLETTVPYIDLEIVHPTEHDLIEKYKNEYLSPFGRKWLAQVMKTAEPYRPYIRLKLAEYGLPQCLEFLPVIESGYKISAVSKTGAKGMWQFAENSIKGLLIKNEWLDQRLDPWLSTEAAIKKLKDNYNHFKDWSLALGAYNMGLGGMQRTINANKTTDFWNLVDLNALKSETKNYVPKFYAIADLLTNYEYYGLDIPLYTESSCIEFEEITLTKQINLDTLADDTGISYTTFRSLNPSLLTPITPPNMVFTLRIPVNTYKIVSDAITNQDSVYNLESYIVKKGDTLWGISRRYGVTVADLCNANNRTEKEILSIGTVLYVPILK